MIHTCLPIASDREQEGEGRRGEKRSGGGQRETEMQTLMWKDCMGIHGLGQKGKVGRIERTKGRPRALKRKAKGSVEGGTQGEKAGKCPAKEGTER